MKNTNVSKTELAGIFQAIKQAAQNGITKAELKTMYSTIKVAKALDLLQSRNLVKLLVYHEKGQVISRKAFLTEYIG